MNKQPSNKETGAEENIADKDILHEAHEDLNEFRETKKSINDLLNYRMSLMNIANADKNMINEFKGKAIDAINHLFDEHTYEKGE